MTQSWLTEPAHCSDVVTEAVGTVWTLLENKISTSVPDFLQTKGFLQKHSYNDIQ